MLLHPYLGTLLVEAHVDDLRREAARAALRKVARDSTAQPQVAADLPITIRPAHPDDTLAVARLAQLDSAMPLEPPLLLAEVGGELRAALPLANGEDIADPFRPSQALTQLLIARAAQLRVERPTRLRWLSRLAHRAPRLARASSTAS